MSFLKDFKDDLTQAVNELVSDDAAKTEEKEAEIEDVKEEDIEELGEDMMAELDLDAISDLLGVDDVQEEDVLDEIEEKTEEISEEVAEEVEKVIEDNIQEEVEMSVDEAAMLEEVVGAVSEPAEEFDMNDGTMPSDEITEITKGTNITGNISSDGSINIYGKITGDVSCKGKMIITGTVKGVSHAGEIFANNCKVEGDVKSDGSVKIGNGSVIIGNVYATSAVIGGAIKGDIDVHGPVIVDATAVVQGNIKSRSVQINNGAAIEGFCSQCYADVDYQALFEDTFK